jgi:hypothetical protein
MNQRATSISRQPSVIRHPSESGIALILTLAILALVTLLLIAFVTSMRVENMASKNYNAVIKARELAQGAIDQAVAQIRQATPLRTASPLLTYVTFPGGAYVNKNGTPTPYSLYSDPTLADPTNLNSGLWITGGTNSQGEFLPNSPNTQINVGWLYVARDGTVGPPSLVSGKELIGRFAYWVDDEASKININAAGQPTVTAPPSPDFGYSTSNEVDLSVLVNGMGASAPGIISARTPDPFTTIQEVKRAAPGITADIFDDNRFEITTYSNDGNYPLYADDLDAFDRQRMVISQLNNPRDIDGSLDATGTLSAYTRLTDANLATLYGNGANGTPQAFFNKYGGKPGVEQLIANIIAYQQPPTVPPPDSNPGGLFTVPTYLGLAKTPYINEVRVQYQVSGGPPPAPVNVTRIVSVELYYMYDGTYVPNGDSIQVSGLPALQGFNQNVTMSGPSGGLSSGSYSVYNETEGPVSSTTAYPAILAATPQVVYTRQYTTYGTRRLSFAQLPAFQSASPSGPATIYQGAQAGDPCLNASVSQWESYPTTSFQGTLGGRNVWQSGIPPGGTSRAFPFIADSSKMGLMRGAAMQSLGELGYIHTPNAFQYLTLQPGGGTAAGSGVIPDWALLDLFTVGIGTGGRININSTINPGLGVPAPATPRLVPLEALLNSMISPSNLKAVAGNIYEDWVNDRGSPDRYGMPSNGRYGVFDTIGEICEISSLANGANTQAGAEAAIRRIANLITVRSNTFRIWVLAQSIKQPGARLSIPLGQFDPKLDVITGDVKAEAVVERYENPPGTTPKYRLRYFRYLYN